MSVVRLPTMSPVELAQLKALNWAFERIFRPVPLGEEILNLCAAIRQRWPDRLKQRTAIRLMVRQLRELRSFV